MVTDERGKKRKITHDFLGRLKEAQDLTSAGAVYGKAVYSYNELDQLLKIEHYNDASAHQDRTFSYDGYGRVTSETTPEEGTVSYEYYANDQVKKVSHAGKGTSITYSYNNRDLIKDVDYSDSTSDVHYEYGEYGERTLMQEKNSGGTVIASTSYSYDSYKRLQKETRGFNGFAGTYSVGYQYNYVGLTQVNYQVTNSANPTGWTRRVNYGYNYAGSLTGVGTDLIGIDPSSTTNVVKNLVYKGFGGIKSLNYGANPRKLALGYDQKRHQMTSMLVQKSDGTDSIIDQAYDYYNGSNNNGRIQKITDNVDGNYSTTYGYDDLNRLVSAQAKAYTRNYSYDNWGNLTGVTAGGASETGSYSLSYDKNGSGAPATNQIKGYTYDAAGNLTNDGTQTLTYDAANRIKTTSSGGSEYDGDGRRVKQSASGYSTYYLWSSLLGEVSVEINSDGTIYRAYVYGPGGGQVLAQQSYDGKFYWIHTDHLGSGKKLTDSSGAVVYRGEFDPHGQAVLESATGGATYLNSHKFTGYEREWATNLDYAKARTYNHNRARFMQPDPMSLGSADLSNPQSLNRYSYVGNDPVNVIDPSGLWWLPLYGKACVSSGGETSCEEYVVAFAWVDDGIYPPMGGGVDGEGGSVGGQGEGQGTVNDAITKAEALLQGDCQNAIENLLTKAFTRLTNNAQPSSPEEMAYIKSITSASAVLGAIKNATYVFKPSEEHAWARATATWGDPNGTITLYRGFFGQKIKSDVSINNSPSTYYVGRSTAERARSLIHEGLHLVLPGYSDPFLGSIISGKNITDIEKGSEAINRFLDKHCK